MPHDNVQLARKPDEAALVRQEGHRIRLCILATGASEASLARRFGLEQARLNQNLNGRGRVPASFVRSLCDVYGFSADFITLGLTDDASLSRFEEIKLALRAQIKKHGLNSVTYRGKVGRRLKGME